MEEKVTEKIAEKSEAEKFEEERHKLLQMAEISIWLDTYDDIFSDFDPRPYSERAISDDFLYEVKKAVREKRHDVIQLKMLIPKDQRNLSQEATIKKRLLQHFQKQYEKRQREVKRLVQKSVLMIFVGIFFMLSATYILFSYSTKENFVIIFLTVLLEPAGWFFFWEGLNHLFFSSEDKIKELETYKKMLKCEIKFLAY